MYGRADLRILLLDSTESHGPPVSETEILA